ncbi:MAG: hypothetical protein ABSB19_05735 [Methylomonas sp.]|jgi:hypothetical protein
MIVFIVFCLLLAALVVNQSPYLPLLTTPLALGINLTLMAASLLAGYLKKIAAIYWHDGFATSGLLVWYGYWLPQFNADAPMFIFYPLYLALLSAVVSLALIQKSRYFDRESIDYLRNINKIIRFDISASIVFVLIGIIITRHYALYVMAMTFFIFRHAVNVCLEIIDQS